jgi:hypothetical protein
MEKQQVLPKEKDKKQRKNLLSVDKSSKANQNKKEPIMKKEIKFFIAYLVVWISQNLSIPFWMIGHVHLSVNVYEDIYEIIASVGMNVVVAIGFIISYVEEKKKKNDDNNI